MQITATSTWNKDSLLGHQPSTIPADISLGEGLGLDIDRSQHAKILNLMARTAGLATSRGETLIIG